MMSSRVISCSSNCGSNQGSHDDYYAYCTPGRMMSWGTVLHDADQPFEKWLTMHLLWCIMYLVETINHTLEGIVNSNSTAMPRGKHRIYTTSPSSWIGRRVWMSQLSASGSDVDKLQFDLRSLSLSFLLHSSPNAVRSLDFVPFPFPVTVNDSRTSLTSTSLLGHKPSLLARFWIFAQFRRNPQIASDLTS